MNAGVSIPIAESTNDTTGSWKITPAPINSHVRKLK
jgi:hypothetical protein|tara:strand:- start:127 stop:234 length:108 start_codon:yes stop_codon:yes gene_type:complete